VEGEKRAGDRPVVIRQVVRAGPRKVLPDSFVALIAQRPLVTAAVCVVAGAVAANVLVDLIGRARARQALGHSRADHRLARQIGRLPPEI
jgi:hypothetical protein